MDVHPQPQRDYDLKKINDAVTPYQPSEKKPLSKKDIRKQKEKKPKVKQQDNGWIPWLKSFIW